METIDPNDIEALKRRIAELEGARQSAGTTIATEGGAVVQGSVEASGHFIGRDFVQYVTQIVQSGEDPEEAKSIVAAYLQALADDLAGLNLGEIDPSATDPKRQPLQLADIYVPLDTTLYIHKDETLEQWRASAPGRMRQREQLGLINSRTVSALEALACHRELTLLGKPGSGKSTFGAYVALALAQAWRGHGEEIANLGPHWTYGALLPIRVILRRFAEQLPPGEKPARAGDLWAFIARDLEARGYGLSTEPIRYIQRIARKHGALIFLDGLDECGSAATRQRVLGAVGEIQRHAGPQCRFLLTARPYAFPGGPDPAVGVYALADLDDEQVEQFIRAWYATLVTRRWLSASDAERKMTDLLDARKRPDLLPLVRNPLLLTLTSALHVNRGLPQDRADLYNESVDLLMLRWNREIGADKALLVELNIPSLKLSDLREVLEQLAFEVHAESIAKGGNADSEEPDTREAKGDGAADIGEDRLVRAFRPLLNGSRDKAAVVVDYIEKRAGLLIGQGEKKGERQFTFPHRTFQEFLAACHLANQGRLNDLGVALARQHAEHWQQVLVLAARQAKADRGTSLADAMIGGKAYPATPDGGTSGDFVRAVLAADQLLEIGLANLASSELRSAIRQRVATWLVHGLQAFKQVPEPPGRQYMGDLLARLGDPRFDPQRFHLPDDDMIGFVRVDADRDFTIGTRKADRKRVAQSIGGDVPGNEINDVPTPTPEFYIARYPVTVANFRAFVEARQFEIGDADALRDPDSRPVRYVSWREALAYCAWLNDVLATSSVLDGNTIARLVRERAWRASLPSELEWEKAARGGLRDAVYASGDTADPNRANYSDSEIGNTSAVGCFPANGHGLHDMLGNVWEWTRSHYVSYPYRADDGREDPRAEDDTELVVRGGSWGNGRVYARCACRFRGRPGVRSGSVGFRVVLRSARVS